MALRMCCNQGPTPSLNLQAVLAEFACTWAFLFIVIGVRSICALTTVASQLQAAMQIKKCTRCASMLVPSHVLRSY